MLAGGISVAFDELPLSVRLPAAVSASPTVNGRAPVLVSSLIVWFPSTEIVGGVLGPVTTVCLNAMMLPIHGWLLLAAVALPVNGALNVFPHIEAKPALRT